MTSNAPQMPIESNGTPNPLTGSVFSTESPTSRNAYHTTLSATLAHLEVNTDNKSQLRNEDLSELQELCRDNRVSVKKVEHIPTGTIMAKKMVFLNAKPSVRKQILRELAIMHHCNSKYIISFFGAFLDDPNVCICMEFMDKGSFDSIYKKIGPIDIGIVGKIAFAVLEGLTYLYDVHRIIHRDMKPSNILCNSRGDIKICDFGKSGELINSVAETFIGTPTYMSPERIQGRQYTVKSDVWSLGISLIELALGRFPFAESLPGDFDLPNLGGMPRPGAIGLLPPHRDESITEKDKRKNEGMSLGVGDRVMSILELLQQIISGPAPRLTPDGRFPKEAEDFVDSCLLKDPDARWTPKDLLKHIWIEQVRVSGVDVKAWTDTF